MKRIFGGIALALLIIVVANFLYNGQETLDESWLNDEDLSNDDIIEQLTDNQYEAYFQRTDLAGEQAVKIGDLIVDNHIYSFDIWDPYKYEELDWLMDPFDDNSWKLYLHSLRMVSFLVNAYEETNDEVYLEKAMSITEDWIVNNPDNDSVSNWAWSDHAVSNRMLNLTNLYEQLQRSSIRDIGFNKLLLQSLYEHGLWQVEEGNYRFPHNHGVMQDRALIQVATLFERFDFADEWFDLGVERLKKQLEASISESGVHLEHSPGYHIHTFELFQEVNEVLSKDGLSLGEEFSDDLMNMKEYLAYVFKPDGSLPLIGDTVQTDLEHIDHLEHPYLDFIRTQGKEGAQPTDVSKVYEDAGVAILRDEWKDAEEFDQSTYVMLQAGYHSNVHKHADDLSLVLYSMGEDIFVGPGKYMYTSNPMRYYMLSSLSHNTVTVDGAGYDLDLEKIDVFIKESELTEEYDRVVAEHSLYEGITFTREIILLKPNVLVILDALESDQHHTYEQRFNLNPDAELLNFDNFGMTAALGDNLKIKIQQLETVDEVHHYKGSDEPIRGYVSYYTNQLTPVDQLEFVQKGKTANFVTIVEMESDQYSSPVESVEFTEGNLYYIKNEERKEIILQ
ncbi:alginate lyase family protein [Alkalihalophilus marmarensis]|uniref:alginate lyase family protein n=1 Tax=Alkalihalophilus marmarensis TaxID=521377 RepID=UPI002E2326AB|nr:alginate lyase family protein [Alkalihalophilus marmarensis]